MAQFIKGLDLCRGFFKDIAKPILDKNFPDLVYSAGLIGYGSDVLGYDDATSTDHMWGPRFYMFLDQSNISKKQQILDVFADTFPYEYKGYSVNFTEPDPNDNGVQHARFITSGKVNPLIFIYTFDDYLAEQLGTSDIDGLSSLDWLTLSEHRLLSLVSGKMFEDGLNIMDRVSALRFYPKEVKEYLIASNWDIIASEQAFVKRCADCGDDIGSRLVCTRIAERLMRLCFLYKEKYAPYSKWFGTAFSKLDVDDKIKSQLTAALSADDIAERERAIVDAQASVAQLHNISNITQLIDYAVESYFGRNIKVIFADKFADAVRAKLIGTEFENVPLIGSLSQIGGLCSITDDVRYREQIKSLYR